MYLIKVKFYLRANIDLFRINTNKAHEINKRQEFNPCPLFIVVKKKITFSETSLALFASSAERCSLERERSFSSFI